MLLALRVFLPFACGYFVSYVYRTVNAIIAPDLVRDLGLTPADLGLMTSAYLLTFGAVQIPLGIALDRWGPSRTNAALLVFAALGAALFAVGDDTATLTLARGLIGLGVAACLMGAFKAFVQWFPKERWALANGLILGVGGLGAIAAAGPVEAILTFTDWRGLFVGLALLTLFAAVAVQTVVPKPETAHVDSHLIDALKGVGRIFSSRVFWSFAPWAAMVQSVLLSVHGLWAGPWLRDVAGLDRSGVAAMLTVMAVALAIGFVAAGAIADRLARFGIKASTVGAVGMVLFMLVQASIVIGGAAVATVAWPLFCLLGTFGTLCYAALTHRFPTHLAGRVNTGINLIIFAFAFVAQWGVGAVVGQWPSTAIGYAPEGYRVALGLLLAAQTLGLIWFALSAGWAGFHETPSKTIRAD